MALHKFYNLVKDGAKFDVKDNILALLGDKVKINKNWYEYSTPGNILYGYYGAAAGFDLEILQRGAGFAQIMDVIKDPLKAPRGQVKYKMDTEDDYYAVLFGNELYESTTLDDGVLGYQEFINAIESYDFADNLALVTDPGDYVPWYGIPYSADHFDN
jgi:hypothetical protein